MNSAGRRLSDRENKSKTMERRAHTKTGLTLVEMALVIATIALLVLSYLYGTWRLPSLQGPSVEEYRKGVEAPWKSQRRGF